jgi:hypothetical protein
MDTTTFILTKNNLQCNIINKTHVKAQKTAMKKHVFIKFYKKNALYNRAFFLG